MSSRKEKGKKSDYLPQERATQEHLQQDQQFRNQLLETQTRANRIAIKLVMKDKNVGNSKSKKMNRPN